MVTKELAISHRQIREPRHAHKDVSQCLLVELSRGDIEFVNERIVPLDGAHVLVLKTCNTIMYVFKLLYLKTGIRW